MSLRKSLPNCCINCLVNTDLQLHRIKPGWAGGKYEKENVILLCSKCHNRLHSIIRATLQFGEPIENYNWNDFVVALKSCSEL